MYLIMRCVPSRESHRSLLQLSVPESIRSFCLETRRRNIPCPRLTMLELYRSENLCVFYHVSLSVPRSTTGSMVKLRNLLPKSMGNTVSSGSRPVNPSLTW